VKPVPRRLQYGEEATLVEHLGELRTRIVIAVVSVLAAFTLTYTEHARIVGWLNRPLPERLHKPTTFSVAEPFMTSLWVSFWAGLLLALPIVIWQVWAFLAPALEEHHQRNITLLVGFVTVLLVAGVFFGYFVALPAAVHFLTNYDTRLYNVQLRAKDYYSFCTQVMVAVGLVFEVPAVMLGLVQLRVLSARQLRRTWRIGLAAMAVLAVALPGVDPITTTLEMIPLMALYLLSIGLATVIERKRRREPLGEIASIGEP
jgi:sec-independent protein translocase protein TatC